MVIPAFIIIGNNSVYPSQQVRLQKSPWVPIPVGRALEEASKDSLPFPWTRKDPSQPLLKERERRERHPAAKSKVARWEAGL